MSPVKISFARKNVNELLPGVLLIERELHGTFERVTQESEVKESRQRQRQQVVRRLRELVPVKSNEVKFARRQIDSNVRRK